MTNGKVFSRFDTASDVIGNVKEAVSAGIWSDGTGTLSTFHTKYNTEWKYWKIFLRCI